MADQVPPTRMALQTYKTKRTGSTKGHQLLKKKADALKARFQGIAKEIYATKATMADACGAAFFSLTAAQYAAGDFKNKVLEGSFEGKKSRSNPDFDLFGGRSQLLPQLSCKVPRFLGTFIHFPVADDDGFSHGESFSERGQKEGDLLRSTPIFQGVVSSG